jgi:hypothetical protein
VISDDLGSLSDWCLGIAAKGRPLHPDRLAHLAKCLLDLSHQARRLENLPIDAVTLDTHDDD